MATATLIRPPSVVGRFALTLKATSPVSIAYLAGSLTASRRDPAADRRHREPPSRHADRLRRRAPDRGAVPAPRWDLTPIERYLDGGFNFGVGRGRTMPLVATRGCPYRCTFCSSPRMWTTRYTTRAPAALDPNAGPSGDSSSAS